MFETLRVFGASAAGAIALRLILLILVIGGALFLLPVWQREGEEPGAMPTVRQPVLLPVAPPPPQAKPRPALSPDQARRWFRPLTLGEARFAFQPKHGVAPADLCARLLQTGWARDRAGAAPGGEREECALTRVYPKPAGGQATRLFALARGARGMEDAALDIRVKINLYDEGAAEAAGQDVSAALVALLDAAGLAPEATTLSVLAGFQPFEAQAGGAKIALKTERADIRRFNLTILLPRPFEGGATDRFDPHAAMPKGYPPAGLASAGMGEGGQP
ncbi:DUF6030 family protein [Aureimonas sp. AU40]|uniref:DUF6030 family protein n=1 Tax=Aureimonas sp. AU40 TaxID=1637747 RepID=UPI0007841506|nr:DUF6030 family protein [Aureimonas sp. AU40]